jgi:ABC-type Fe3+-siderophore transport system permease subunit/ABC-type Fe3+-hydroxamate transport system substrate-binding protein
MEPLSGFRSHMAMTFLPLVVALCAAMQLGISVGPVTIAPSHVAAIVLAPLAGRTANVPDRERLVVWQLRLPRVLVAALVGAGLAVSGAALQALYRNPLADPGVIGVSAGAAAGAVLSIACGVNRWSVLALPLCAFAGALASASAVYGLASLGGEFSTSTLLLSGVALTALLSATVTAILTLTTSGDALREMVFWLSGGFDGRTWEHVAASAPFIVFGTLAIASCSRELNLLTLGEEDAGRLGAPVRLLRPLILGCAALVIGAAVAVSGTIAFVGLIVPHAIRLIAGPDHRRLVPYSAIGGAAFLVGADLVGRTIARPLQLQVGVVTAFIGAPFFLALLLKRRGRWALMGGCLLVAALTATVRAAGTEEPWPRTIEGMDGTVTLEKPPRRVQTTSLGHDEVTLSLVAANCVVAVGQYTKDPMYSNVAAEAANLPITGRDPERIASYSPDLVIATRLDPPELVTSLRRIGLRVLRMDVHNDLEGRLADVRLLGRAFGADTEARELIDVVRRRSASLKTAVAAVSGGRRPAVLSLTFYADRLYVAGLQSTEGGIIEQAGANNAAGAAKITGNPLADIETIIALNPDAIVIHQPPGSAEPFRERLLANPALASVPAIASRRVFVLSPRLFTTLSFWNLRGAEELAHALWPAVRIPATFPAIDHPLTVRSCT